MSLTEALAASWWWWRAMEKEKQRASWCDKPEKNFHKSFELNREEKKCPKKNILIFGSVDAAALCGLLTVVWWMTSFDSWSSSCRMKDSGWHTFPGWSVNKVHSTSIQLRKMRLADVDSCCQVSKLWKWIFYPHTKLKLDSLKCVDDMNTVNLHRVWRLIMKLKLKVKNGNAELAAWEEWRRKWIFFCRFWQPLTFVIFEVEQHWHWMWFFEWNIINFSKYHPKGEKLDFVTNSRETSERFTASSQNGQSRDLSQIAL